MKGIVLTKLQRYMSRGSFVALLSVLAIFMFAGAANVAAQAGQGIVVSQITWGAAWPNGGAFSGENVAGNSWAMNSKGVVVASETYGGSIIQFASPGYTQSVAGPVSNGSGVAIDSNDNLYVSDEYNQEIVKIAPTGTVTSGKYTEGSTGTYSWTADPTSSSAYAALTACTGVNATDQALGMCSITEPASIGYFGVEAMAVDKANNLYIASDDSGAGSGTYGTPAWSIYKCGSTCLGGTAAPILVYSEPLSTTPSTTGQLYLGDLSFDYQGNLYFNDAAVSKDSNQTVVSSNLNELQATTAKNTGFGGATTGFVAAPTILITETNASPGQYDDHISSVWVDKGVGTPGAGTVYFGLANSGIYAMPSNKGVVNTAGLYAISNQGDKMIMEDSYGNLLMDGYTTAVNTSGADTFAYVGLHGPNFPKGTTTATVLVADNTEPCPAAGLSLAFTNSEFSAGAPGTCATSSLEVASTTGVAALVPYTITLTPATGVAPSSSLTASDSASGASTSTIAKGGVISSIDQSAFGPLFLAGGVFGADSSDSHSAAINAAGYVYMGTSYGSGQIQQFQRAASGTITVTEVGPFSGAGGMAVDSNNYLYASGEYENTILKLPPQANGSYPTFTTITGLPTCTGTASDSAGVCEIVLGGSTWTTDELGISALIFDSKGNLFFDTNDEGTAGNGQYSVYECGPTCLYGASPTAPVLLFAEQVPSDSNSDQYYPGPIAVDSNDNVFFTDALVDVTGASYVHTSNLWELPVDSSNANGYAATPTLLETISPACDAAPCKYNNDLDGLVIDKNNNIFLADQYTGIFELPAGSYDAPPIAIAAPGAKSIVEDTLNPGSFFFSGYNNGDSIGYDLVGSATIAGNASSSAPTSATVTVLDNFGCDQSPTLGFTFSDTTDTWAGTQGGSTNMALGGGCGLSSTVTFTPAATTSGAVTTTMTASDTVNGGAGTASVSATAAVAQLVVLTGITSPVTYSPTASFTLGVTGNTSGNAPTFTISSTGNTAGASLTGDTLTYTSAGAFTIDIAVAGGTVSGTTYAAFSGSAAITVNPAAQTISFTPPTSAAYGSKLTLSATGGASGNPVTFTLDASSTAGVATLSGSSLTVTGIGSIVIDANQASSADYAAATPVQATIAAVPAPQTITFAAGTPTTLAFGGQTTLSATGGASGNAVTFSIDASSTAGAGSLTGSTLTATGLGTIVIDANQAGSTDYAAATQAQASITVTSLGTVAAPTFSPASGTVLSTGTGGLDTVTISSATGTTVYYTTNGTTPTAASTQYTAPFTLTTAGTATVEAIAMEAGYNASTVATATYTVTSTPPAFTAAASSGTSSSPITITSSTPGTTTLTITPAGGFDQQISFACTASTGITVTCSFSPSSVTPNGSDSAIPVTVTMSKGSTAFLQKGTNPFLPGGETLAAITLCFFGWKKRRSLLLALGMIAVAFTISQLTACGGASSKSGTVTINATAGTTTVATTVNVVVK
jgi:hypothetical protein